MTQLLFLFHSTLPPSPLSLSFKVLLSFSFTLFFSVVVGRISYAFSLLLFLNCHTNSHPLLIPNCSFVGSKHVVSRKRFTNFACVICVFTPIIIYNTHFFFFFIPSVDARWHLYVWHEGKEKLSTLRCARYISNIHFSEQQKRRNSLQTASIFETIRIESLQYSWFSSVLWQPSLLFVITLLCCDGTTNRIKKIMKFNAMRFQKKINIIIVSVHIYFGAVWKGVELIKSYEKTADITWRMHTYEHTYTHTHAFEILGKL